MQLTSVVGLTYKSKNKEGHGKSSGRLLFSRLRECTGKVNDHSGTSN
jgi:hypothetical protein